MKPTIKTDIMNHLISHGPQKAEVITRSIGCTRSATTKALRVLRDACMIYVSDYEEPAESSGQHAPVYAVGCREDAEPKAVLTSAERSRRYREKRQ
ncbi:hypothetical protein CHELA1G11_10873 [Hyphomicrobiales bacterium]|nr:hypothetical protein CHELA1G11_10873 [Hyphomicrobiales bacterium]CAH1671712.1 hypothetical protein CHELA1G2_13435 [Hyphomicrobiales bacterium]